MKTHRAITIGILILTAVLLIVWDIYVYLAAGSDATISRVLLWAGEHPVLPFSFGVLFGHLFWPQTKTRIVTVESTESGLKTSSTLELEE